MTNDPCPQNNPHLDLDLVRMATGPGLQISLGDQLLRLLSEPKSCKS